jgi:hypothetical protein
MLGISNKWHEELFLECCQKKGLMTATEEPIVKELKEILGEEGYAREYTTGTKFTTENAIKLTQRLLHPEAEPETKPTNLPKSSYRT